MKPKIAIVIPTNRPEMFLKWLEAWKEEFSLADAIVICVFDGIADDKLRDKASKLYHWLVVYDHFDYDLILKDKAWVIPKKAGACKSFGIYRAWKEYNVDYVITLDDDCMPAADDNLLIAYTHFANMKFRTSNYFDIG